MAKSDPGKSTKRTRLKLRWLSLATRERRRQVQYIADRNPYAGVNIDEQIERRVAQLCAHPFIGRPGRLPGSRELVITGTSFIAVYRVTGDTVEILRFMHGAQTWPSAH